MREPWKTARKFLGLSRSFSSLKNWSCASHENSFFLSHFALRPPAETPPITLENVRVASPCQTSWEKMQGDDRVRHCQECKLNVYNLSEMTRKDAERLIAKSEGRLCVRFYRRADGTSLPGTAPEGCARLPTASLA